MAAQILKPRALEPGDTVGVVAPAAAVEREALERGVNALSAMGFRVRISPHALDRCGIFAGDDEDRAHELGDFFADPAIAAIFAARGGYGCGRLLPLLDFAALARSPKPFVGFSDETFVLNALVARAGMVAFHGPMVAMELARGLSSRALDQMKRMLTGEGGALELTAREVLHPGAAEGVLIGGCLSVMVAMIGTPWLPDFRGKILFLEDTNERAYRIDRMLVQLKQAGLLAQAAAVAFGALRPPDGDEQERRLIAHFIAEQTAELKIPVLSGLEVGHGSENCTLPLGVRARVDSRGRTLTITESPVIARERDGAISAGGARGRGLE